MATESICKIPACGNGGKLSRGWCGKHYATFLRHGDPTKRVKMGPKGRPANSRMPWLEAQVGFAGQECLTWPFLRNQSGYGIIRSPTGRTRASRVMCELAHGPAPSNRHEAAHSCGNGHEGCVNPRHLRWATRQENARDAIGHGTWVHGETVGNSKLTESDVRAIRTLAGKVLQREIAERFGVSRKAIGLIISGKNWAWLI